MFKKVLPAAVAASLLAGATATSVQAGEISANVALTSDYRFRGISQSNDDIAVQGGFDYAWDNGIYVGTWGSVVDFDLTSDDGLNGSLELDYYVGWSSDIGENSAIDVGYLYYDYPGDSSVLEGDYQEVYGSFSFHDLTVKEAEILGAADHLGSEIDELIGMVDEGTLDLSEVVTGTVALEADAINEVLDRLESFSGGVRTVITPRG